MRQRQRSIHLSKETLRYLDPKEVQARLVVGGATDDSFIQSCFYNTCYHTCDWTFPQLEQG
jgi:hypothetical protein